MYMYVPGVLVRFLVEFSGPVMSAQTSSTPMLSEAFVLSVIDP